MRNIINIMTCIFICVSCSKSTSSNEIIRIGISPWPPYDYIYLAHEKKYFQEFGINTQIVEFSSPADLRRGFERGQVDVMVGTTTELVLAKENSTIKPKAFYVIDSSNGADVVLALPHIKSFSDLRGKKVGVEKGALCMYLLYRALELHSMSLSDILIVPMTQDFMEDAIRTKTVDAVVTFPPYSTNIMKNVAINQLFSSKAIPFEILDLFITSDAFLKKHKVDLEKIIKGYEKAKLYANTPGSDGWEIMANREQMTVNDFKATINEDVFLIPFAEQKKVYFDSGKLNTLIERMSRVLFEMKEISRYTQTNDIAKWITHE